MKKIRFHPNVQGEVRAIEQKAALNILETIHRYAQTGEGRVPLHGEFEGLLRLRAGNHRISLMKPRTPSPSIVSATAKSRTVDGAASMKFSEIANRLTGISKPALRLLWETSELEIACAIGHHD